MSTGTPTTIKFLKYDHPIGELYCLSCWDLEAPLCEEPRCEGHVHEEVDSVYTDEGGIPVTIVRQHCDGCNKEDTYEWWDDEAEDDEYEAEEDDPDEE